MLEVCFQRYVFNVDHAGLPERDAAVQKAGAKVKLKYAQSRRGSRRRAGIKLRCPRRSVVRHDGGPFERAAALSRWAAMPVALRLDVGRCREAADHGLGIRLRRGRGRQLGGRIGRHDLADDHPVKQEQGS
jgi:hypothetical protein